MIVCLLWLILGLIFLFFELFTPGLFFFLSFFIGSLGASLTSYFDLSLFWQIVSFFCSALFSFAFLFLLLKKSHYLDSRHGQKTNVFALQGKHAEVIEAIKPMQVGHIKIGGEIWSAKGRETDYFPIGSLVEVVDITGCHCIVRLVKLLN